MPRGDRAKEAPPDAAALTVEQAAERLQVTGKTVRNLIDRGELRVSRVGRLLRIRPEEIDAFLQRSEEKRPSASVEDLG